MAEIRTVTTLRRKRDEIVSAIKLYEHQPEQAKADLAHVIGAIRLFDADGNAKVAEQFCVVFQTVKNSPRTTTQIARVAG